MGFFSRKWEKWWQWRYTRLINVFTSRIRKYKRNYVFYFYIRYHPTYYEMILSTGSNGFHVFKPAINEIAVSSSGEEDDPKDI
mgnify:CR=1 FL=1